MQVGTVDDIGRRAVLFFKTGERGRVDLLVIAVPPDARTLESDGLRLEPIKDAKVAEDSAEVGCDLFASGVRVQPFRRFFSS